MSKAFIILVLLAAVGSFAGGAAVGLAIKAAGEQSPTQLSYSQFSKEW